MISVLKSLLGVIRWVRIGFVSCRLDSHYWSSCLRDLQLWGFKIGDAISLDREEDCMICIVCVPRFADVLPVKFSRTVSFDGVEGPKLSLISVCCR